MKKTTLVGLVGLTCHIGCMSRPLDSSEEEKVAAVVDDFDMYQPFVDALVDSTTVTLCDEHGQKADTERMKKAMHHTIDIVHKALDGGTIFAWVEDRILFPEAISLNTGGAHIIIDPNTVDLSDLAHEAAHADFGAHNAHVKSARESNNEDTFKVEIKEKDYPYVLSDGYYQMADDWRLNNQAVFSDWMTQLDEGIVDGKITPEDAVNILQDRRDLYAQNYELFIQTFGFIFDQRSNTYADLGITRADWESAVLNSGIVDLYIEAADKKIAEFGERHAVLNDSDESSAEAATELIFKKDPEVLKPEPTSRSMPSRHMR